MLFLHTDSEIIELDGDTKQTHSAKASISNFPLEDGSFTNDHTILKPKIFTAMVVANEEDNPSELLAKLEKLRDERTLITIESQMALRENYLIEGVDTVEDSSSGEMVMFSLVFKEVKFSKSKQVKIERKQLKDTAAKDKLQSKSNRGAVDHKKIKVEKVSIGPGEKVVKKKDEAVVKQPDNSSILYRIMK